MRTESVSSRDSTVSVMEYLNKRRLKEASEVDISTPVTLEEYDKNCYVRTFRFSNVGSLTVAQLYDCELLHIVNPNRTDSQSPPVIHCGCDPERPSRKHLHINDPPEVRQAIRAMRKERGSAWDGAHKREQSTPRPPDKPPASTIVAAKALPPTPRSPRKRTGHVSQRPENIPTALVAALNDTEAQGPPKDHGSPRVLAESTKYRNGVAY